ncbi:MAG: hypothetical protein BGO69_02440 [Bacteroidetes bacterium 46-16]|nr:MAG: hypothetical protein BGO69_02440 [Bacteroidetes bacterium 46-16]
MHVVAGAGVLWFEAIVIMIQGFSYAQEYETEGADIHIWGLMEWQVYPIFTKNILSHIFIGYQSFRF